MKCPDCKTELEQINTAQKVDERGNPYGIEIYYKCPKCRIEFEEGDI